jgi:hypothetical protein
LLPAGVAGVAGAVGGDAGEMLRDRLIFCNQFVIEDPDPAVIRQHPFSAAGSAAGVTIAMFSTSTSVTADAAGSI